MINKIKNFLMQNEWAVVALLVAMFVLIRIPGTDLPLHQDEYKWPMIVNPAYESSTEIPHPPLSQFIYRIGGEIVGFNTNFRFIPLFFGTVSLLLLYYFIRFVFDKKHAFVASLVWVFSYFSVLASLMVDTDGEVMPFFFLLALIGYYKLKANSEKKYFWGGLLLLASVLGFLVKVSFLLAICAIVIDYMWSKRHVLSKAQYIQFGSYGIAGILGLSLLLLVLQYIFPFFDLSKSITYWKHFAVADRNWFQTLIQLVKGVLYASPLLIAVPFFGKNDDFEKVKTLLFFLLFSFIFYIVLFDFSIGALDRYLQLMILPLTILSAIVITRILTIENKRTKEFMFLGIIIAIILVILQSIPHYVPPLHPKSDWINRVLSFRWNFLYPFSGGSGPLGFYVSFLFIALCWIIGVAGATYSKIRPYSTKLLLTCILPVLLVYNLVFIGEYLYGMVNGSAPQLLTEAIAYMKGDSQIKMVTVYNDNGGNEVREIGKYRKRLYVDPKFDMQEKISTLNKYKEHYFVLNVPRLATDTVYQAYFDTCTIVYYKTDKAVSATIYDCRLAPDISMEKWIR